MKGDRWSIHSFNRILLISFFSANTIFTITILFLLWITWSKEIIKYIIYADITINFMLIYVYLYINNKYITDFEKLTDFFKKYLDDNKDISIPTWTSFLENKKIESLFKKAYIKSNIQKKDMKDFQGVFDKFIPKDMYEKVLVKWYEKVWLGNCIWKKVTIMFLDIMWFTKISENMSPERSLLLLNIYFDWIWDIVYKKWGYIDKFLWDWIMIIFEQETSDNAIMCSLEIMEFIRKFQVSAVWSKINIWIWINSWEVIMWTIWTKNRMDVTVIWDNVNIASRLQWLTRKYSKKIILSEHTYDLIENKDKYIFEKIWEEKLLWKENTVVLYSMEEYYKVEI